jgi:hypothetical protein
MQYLIGFVLIVFGSWLTYRKIKGFQNNVPDTLGGNIDLFIAGIGLVVIGTIFLFK